MRTWLAIALVSTLVGVPAGTALAQPDPGVEISPPGPDLEPARSDELVMSSRSLAAVLHGFSPRTGFRAGVFVSAAGVAEAQGDRIGTAAVGGTVATGGLSDRCRYLSIDGAIYATATHLAAASATDPMTGDAGQHYSAATTTSVCLFRKDIVDMAAPGLTVTHHLEYDVRPALSSRRTWLRRRHSGQSVTVDGSAFEGKDSQLPYASALFPYHVAVDKNAQEGNGQAVWMVSVDIEAVTFTPPRTIIMGDPHAPAALIHIPADELAILGLFIRTAQADGGLDVTVGGLDLGRIDGLDVAPNVTLDAKVGLALGSIWDRSGPEPQSIADVTSPRGYLGATFTWEPATWTARYTRDVSPTFDGAIAIEDRLSHAVQLHRGLPGVQLTGFAAYTTLYEMAGTTGDWTGGATVARTWDLGDHLSFLVSGEVARSYYARLDADARPVPEAAARVMAVLSARAGTR